MYIENIVIKINDKIHKKYDFNRCLTEIHGSAELCAVIKSVLGLREPVQGLDCIRFFALVHLEETYLVQGVKLRDNAYFKLYVGKNGSSEPCTEEYFEAIHQNKELDAALFFHRFERQDFPRKLFKYMDTDTFYPEGRFAKLTNGYGTTRSFRGFVTSYIKHFKPIRLHKDKNLYLKLSKEGEFKVGYLDSEEPVYLSEGENMLYHFLSFISIADFWGRADRIRNLNCANKPLVISMHTSFLDDRVSLEDVKNKVQRLNRQVILFIKE